MEYAQIADYLLRPANPNDQAQIYHLKAQSVRPYVEKIWGSRGKPPQNPDDLILL